MTKEEARLTLQENFGVMASEYPERVVEALRVAIYVLSVTPFPSDVNGAAEEYSDSMGLQGFDRVRTMSDFKAGVKWYAQKMYRLRELADRMYEAAQYLSTDASRLRKAMEEYHNYRISLRNESK